MFKKDSHADDQFNSCRLNMQGGQKYFSDIRSTRNQYDHVDKFDGDEVKSQYLPKTHCSLNSKDDNRDHFQDLNEKFQELECKMFEVEKCFQEANKREMEEAHRLMAGNDDKFPPEIVQNIQQRTRLYEILENGKESAAAAHPLDGMRDWFGDHHSFVTEKKQFPNQRVIGGSGDAPQLQSEGFSEDSCKTLTMANKPPFNHAPKSIFTINHSDVAKEQQRSAPGNYIVEGKNSTDIDFLEKSKKLILTLIDKELMKIESKPKDFQGQPTTKLKIECINNIERELMALKKLESLDQQ